MSDDSHIHVSPGGGMTFAGPDAVKLFTAITLRGSIKLYIKAKIIPTRGVTITRMLEVASSYTGKPYKRGQAQQAADDLKVWADTMKLGLRVERAP